MKKSILFSLLLAGTLMVFSSCKNDEPGQTDYTPGEIPGLGSTAGELTGLPFELPDGIEITAEITGKGDQDGYWNLNSAESAPLFVQKDGSEVIRKLYPRSGSRSEAMNQYFGSGYGYVDLLIPLRNTRNQDVTVTFPAGLILRNDAGDCQNGVLIKEVKVIVPSGEDYYLNLAFYCGNKYKSSAGSSDVYSLGVISDASPLLDLCERVKDKKINIEEFDPTSYTDYYQYLYQVDELQDIVWAVTDKEGLTEEDIEYINSLPNSI